MTKYFHLNKSTIERALQGKYLVDKFRRTSIVGKKKKDKPVLQGDLVDSGAFIFTKTTFNMTTIKKGGGFWRFLIRVIQWFRWSGLRGNPSTITHVDGWDGKVAFGSDLCDPEGGGLNRHHLPIVPHCFIRNGDQNGALNLSNDSIEIVTKRKSCKVLKFDELAIGDYEVIQFPEPLRLDFLFYQEKFRNDDIKYSLTKAAKSAFVKSKFSRGVQKIALADSIFCYLGEPFRDQDGAVIEVCCSTFLAKVLMAIEHKQKLEVLLDHPDFKLAEKWKHSFKNLRRGFKYLNNLNLEFKALLKEFDQEWQNIQKSRSKNKRSLLIHLCVDFEEKRGFYLRKMRKLSAHIAQRIYAMAGAFFNAGYYEKFIDTKENAILFKFNPECVTPAKLYYFLYEIAEKDNEP